MKVKYLIFDFDGVIGDTLNASTKATALVDGISVEKAFSENQEYAHNKPNHTRNHTLTTEELSEIYEWTSCFGKIMNEHGFKLFEDFVDEILKLDTEHLAIVSSGSQKYVIPAMTKSRLDPTHILAFENHHSKEEKIEIICKDWGVGVADVYYFTDTLADIYELKDFIAKRKLIGVSWGYCAYELLAKEIGSQNVLKEPKDIHNIDWE